MPTIHCTVKPYTIDATTIVHLPAVASSPLPSRGIVAVRGTLNNHPVHIVLEPDGRGSHWFELTQDLQTSAKTLANDLIQLSLDPASDWPEPTLPADIQVGLADNPQTSQQWHSFTPIARWDWLRWIRATNSPETRAKHIIVAQSKILSGSRRPCCFNRSICTVPQVSKSGALLEPAQA